MPRVPSSKARQALTELSALVASQDVADALEKAAKDKRLLRKAMANPTGFLRGENIKLPPRAKFKISQLRPGVSGRITICIQVCRQIGRFMFCVQICISIVF